MLNSACHQNLTFSWEFQENYRSCITLWMNTYGLWQVRYDAVIYDCVNVHCRIPFCSYKKIRKNLLLFITHLKCLENYVVEVVVVIILSSYSTSKQNKHRILLHQKIIWASIFSMLKKYILEHRLLLKKELQQRILVLQNLEMLRKLWETYILESKSLYCSHLAKCPELLFPMLYWW